MKKIDKSEFIDVIEERNALFEFVVERWEGVSPDILKDFIDDVFTKSLFIGRFWLDSHACFDAACAWMDEREKEDLWTITEDKDFYLSRIMSYDGVYKIGDIVRSSINYYRDAILFNWDYEKEANKLERESLKDFPDMKKLKPKGYDAAKKNYSDFDGFDKYNEAQADLDFLSFKGVDSSSAGAGGFHSRISLTATLYDDCCQGRNPIRVFVGAILSHALHVQMHNNEVSITNELNNLKKIYFQPEYFKELVYMDDFSNVSKNKFFNAFFLIEKEKNKKYSSKISYSSQEEMNLYLEKQIENHREWMALPEEERERRKKENMAKVMSSFKLNFTREEEEEIKKGKEKLAKIVLNFLNKEDINSLKL